MKEKIKEKRRENFLIVLEYDDFHTLTQMQGYHTEVKDVGLTEQ